MTEREGVQRTRGRTGREEGRKEINKGENGKEGEGEEGSALTRF